MKLTQILKIILAEEQGVVGIDEQMGKREEEREEKANQVIEAKRLLEMTQWSTGSAVQGLEFGLEVDPLFPGPHMLQTLQGLDFIACVVL